jgi:hypothetical protein
MHCDVFHSLGTGGIMQCSEEETSRMLLHRGNECSRSSGFWVI